MPTFHDIALEKTITTGRSRWSFADFIDRELGYAWDGTPEGKIALMQMLEENKEQDSTTSKDDETSGIYTLESHLLPILAHMENQWVRLDKEKLREIGDRIRVDTKRIETEIYEVTGEFFNINSPKQVADLLFGKLSIKPTKKNKTGYSVDNEVLEEIAKDYDVARLILEYRSLTKLQSTYVESLLPLIDTTGRVHTTYGQIGAATGRMSSNDPNLQNIPTSVGYGSEIKSCFVPSEGNIFLVADYSQIELRVLAWLSQDRSLLEAFEKGEDIHARTAKFLFDPVIAKNEAIQASGTLDRHARSQVAEPWKPTNEQRRIAKTVNFWVIYGITGFGLAKTLGAPPWEAQKYIEAFYERYPWVKNYYETILEEGRALGYVETAFGRRRYIPGLTDANKTIRGIAEREAINMPVQWTAADMLKYAMLDIDAKVREKNLCGSMILQVHDELVFDIPKDEVETWETLVRESMENILTKHGPKHGILGDILPPIRVDMHTGENWVEAKG